MSSFLRSFINLFSNKTPPKILQGKTFRKAPIYKKPCVKNATKEVQEIGWMQQPVVKNPPRFRVELASSSNCKFTSLFTCYTELIADQDPPQPYSSKQMNSLPEKLKRLSPIDEFIKTTSFENNCSNNFNLRMKTLDKSKTASKRSKEIAKFQYEQSRLQRKKFSKSSNHKHQHKNAESLSEPVLAKAAPENNQPNPSEILFFLPFKTKVTTGCGHLQNGTFISNQADEKTDTSSKYSHRKPIIYNKKTWLNHLQSKNLL